MPRGQPRRTVRDYGPHPVDVHVGGKVRLRRTLLGMSQEMLGDAVGLTFQQIQKYESGFNRVSASRLWQFSNVLDAPISYFFDDLPDAGKQSADESDSLLTKRESLQLVRAYYRIKGVQERKHLSALIKALGPKSA